MTTRLLIIPPINSREEFEASFLLAWGFSPMWLNREARYLNPSVQHHWDRWCEAARQSTIMETDLTTS